MIAFHSEILKDFESATQREWIVTNGLGGFASSTICGANTRRYHGLLVAANRPPLERMVILSKIDETIFANDKSYDLACNQFPGTIHPHGHQYLELFSYEFYPKFIYSVEGIRLEKSVYMIYEKNASIIVYRLLESPSPIRLSCISFFACRRFHELTHENPFFNTKIETSDGLLRLKPYKGTPFIHLYFSQGRFDENALWYKNFEYTEEKNRGLDFREDLFTPGDLTFELKPNETAFIIASTEELNSSDLLQAEYLESDRKRKLLKNTEKNDKLFYSLILASDSFIVKREENSASTIIAGYHWFSDWGRDTMISLPGLTLATGRFDIAKSILHSYSRYASEGMIPNRFPDEGELPDYNTVDATLWFFNAVYQYYQYTNDEVFVRNGLMGVLKDIISWHEKGTRYKIFLDSDGLLSAGEKGTQLTWMDAKVGEEVITPRIGKPVEVNALWYNALKIMEFFADKFGDKKSVSHYSDLSLIAQRSFNRIFWNKDTNCLYDYINTRSSNSSIRPNQIFAISLPFPILKADRHKEVLQVIEKELLTPFGLRTLSPQDPRYIGRYCGNAIERDQAYHQGTVWPWLLGPYVTAYLRVYGRNPQSLKRVRDLLVPFENHLYESGLGTISELFDGDPPHQPHGSISQAWSVAELLRVIVEELGR